MKITQYKPDDDVYKSGSFIMFRQNAPKTSDKSSATRSVKKSEEDKDAAVEDTDQPNEQGSQHC